MKRKLIGLLLLITVLTVGLVPAAQGQEDAVAVDSATLAYNLPPTVATEWMALAYTVVRDERISAPVASRFYAYVAMALYEGIVPGMPDNYSLGGQLEGLSMMPFPEGAYPEGEVSYDWISSANASIATVMAGLLEEPSPETLDAINAMRAKWEETQRAAVPADGDPEIVDRSLAFGDEVGQVLLGWIENDNYGPTRKLEYELPVSEDGSLWEPTAPDMRPLEPYWGQIRPLAMDYSGECNQRMNITYSTEPESTFYRQAQEVMDVSDNLTEEQREIARFWIDTPGVTGAPAGHWVMIVTQLAEQTEMTLSRAAEAYMLTGAALMDSFISAWDEKYQINLVRPVTYIQRNLRRNWGPYLESPPFPEYPSGHSVASGAAAAVLTRMLGQVAFVDRTPMINGHENIQREYTSIESAGYEAAISRLYGGIHFRMAIENGLAQGRCVAEAVLNRLTLRPVPQGE